MINIGQYDDHWLRAKTNIGQRIVNENKRDIAKLKRVMHFSIIHSKRISTFFHGFIPVRYDVLTYNSFHPDEKAIPSR